jgi:hypothetical protein
MLLRQNGDEDRGWRGLPFWWPVIMTPRLSVTAIFASAQAVTPTSGTNGDTARPLNTEQD